MKNKLIYTLSKKDIRQSITLKNINERSFISISFYENEKDRMQDEISLLIINKYGAKMMLDMFPDAECNIYNRVPEHFRDYMKEDFIEKIYSIEKGIVDLNDILYKICRHYINDF